MSLIRKSLGLWCKIVGHAWRRLRKAERAVAVVSGEEYTAAHDSVKVCARCGIFVAVVPRKKAAA